MSKKSRTDRTSAAEAAEPVQPAAAEESSAPELEEPGALDDALARLTGELEELQDRHLRLVAEFDNFRKRTARERVEIRARAQADLVAGLIDFLDDLDRVAELDPAQVAARDVVEGVALADRKLRRHLEAAGLERIGSEGDRFDPNIMEAMGSLPTDEAAKDHTVGNVFQPGYRFGGHLVRPARVQVHVYQGGADDDE